jgi:hypothetical protein
MDRESLWQQRWTIAAASLGAIVVVLAAVFVWAVFLALPAGEPTPSPTAAAPASPDVSPSPEPPISPSPELSPSPEVSPSPEPTISPEPTASPPVTASPSPTASPQIGWIEITDFPTYRSYTDVASITAGGPGYVAVGSGGRTTRGRVWTSADGLLWTAQPDAQFAGYSLRKVVPFGNDLFVFGRNLRGTRVWRSSDGRNWTQLAESPEFVTVGINEVAVIGGTMIAVGFAEDPDHSGVVWRSTDGVTWARAAMPAGIEELRVVAGRGNTLVGIGTYPHLHGPLIVYSTNLADSWQAAETDLIFDYDSIGGGLVALAALDDRWLAVGYMEAEPAYIAQPVAFSSTDGTRWSSVSLETPGVQLFEQLVTMAGGFLAIGTEHGYWIGECRPVACIGDDQIGRAWMSADGREWRDLPMIYEDTLELTEVGDELVTFRAVAAAARAWSSPNSGTMACASGSAR